MKIKMKMKIFYELRYIGFVPQEGKAQQTTQQTNATGHSSLLVQIPLLF